METERVSPGGKRAGGRGGGRRERGKEGWRREERSVVDHSPGLWSISHQWEQPCWTRLPFASLEPGKFSSILPSQHSSFLNMSVVSELSEFLALEIQSTFPSDNVSLKIWEVFWFLTSHL